MMYQSSHAHKGTPLALSLIADTILNPSFKHDELDVQRDAAAYELREMNSKPDMFLPEVIHSVAYNKRGLGNPMVCPEDRLNTINEGLLRHTIQEWYRPEKMVIAGAGMPHDELVELADKFFSSLKSSPIHSTQHRLTPNTNNALPSQPHLLSPSSPSVAKTLTRAASYLFPNSIPSPLSGITPAIPKSPTSTYTGGHRFILDTNEQLNHLYIAFEGLGIEDDDVYTLAVMQVLLGGGGSFSAGKFPSFVEILQFLKEFCFYDSQAALVKACILDYTHKFSTTTPKSITALLSIISTLIHRFSASSPLLYLLRRVYQVVPRLDKFYPI